MEDKISIPEEIRDIPYYKRRFDLIFGASLLFIVFCIPYILFLLNYEIISIVKSNPIYPGWVSKLSSQPLLFSITIIGSLVVVYLIIIFFNHLGSRDTPIYIAGTNFFNPSPNKSLTILVISTFLFILLVSIPLFSLGGAKESCFGSLLVTICTLTVIITKSNYIRTIFIIICMLFYTLASFYFVEIEIHKTNVYSFIYILVILISIFVAIFLSRKGEFKLFDSVSE